jgi:hypothetical protein
VGAIWVKEFTGGLDTRKMAVTAAGGVLIEAVDGHITRGSEFKKRLAFVAAYTLPAGATKGMANTTGGLVVFGHGAPPAMPVGVTYQQLQHPGASIIPLVRVLSTDLFAGKIYAVAEFADGTRHHFYDGVYVSDWFDGRARASFRVTGGGPIPATHASGSFEVTGGTAGGGSVTNIQIDGVSIISGTVGHTGNNATTAAAIAAAINSHTSVPDYTATASGQTVTVTAAATGPGPNGKAIVGTLTGNMTAGNPVNMSGGADATSSRLVALQVNGIEIIDSHVYWTTSHTATAAAIAAEINSYASSPEYTATAVDDQVNIIAATPGTGPNGFGVSFGTLDGLVLTPTTGLVLSGGATSAGSFVPGTFVYTLGSKVYSAAGPALHFSGIQQPTKWQTSTVGAGFVDMSVQASGSEELTAIAKYQSLLAIFSKRNIQVWQVDSDPNSNRQVQVLNNTGTESPHSVTQVGDDDIYYLNASGLRSLRARDASNAASTTDIGVPVDSVIVEKLRTLTEIERAQVRGLIEPQDGRFWLILKDEIFVFSYFAGSRISAWTKYLPGFAISDALVFQRRVYVRSGDTIYVFGGLSGTQYDSTVAVARLPFLDANAPARSKSWQGYDAAVEGAWDVRASFDPARPDAYDEIGVVFRTSYSDGGAFPIQGRSTHCSLTFRSRGSGGAKLGAVVLHHDLEPDEN